VSPEIRRTPCPVCKKPVTDVCTSAQEIESRTSPPNFDDPIYDQVDGILCDQAKIEGCFGYYHVDCFDKHSCPVHDGKAPAGASTTKEEG